MSADNLTSWEIAGGHRPPLQLNTNKYKYRAVKGESNGPCCQGMA
jgi:hypothetical protein